MASIFKNEALRRLVFRWSGFNKYGLLYDDLLIETPQVQEALRRLPNNLYDARVYRIQRAVQLDLQKEILPRNQWTKYEDNVRYLQPYVDEIMSEEEERKDWDAQK